MTKLRLLVENLLYFRWANLAVLLGMALATAVLTGALMVGDSVRGSLRALAVQRLGPVGPAPGAARGRAVVVPVEGGGWAGGYLAGVGLWWRQEPQAMARAPHTRSRIKIPFVIAATVLVAPKADREARDRLRDGEVADLV